jgi:hypothetical protein
MNTTNPPTNSTTDSENIESNAPRRCYDELDARFQSLATQCAQLSKRVVDLERAASAQSDLLRQLSELLKSCLDALKSAVTRAEFETLCNRLNMFSNLLPAIADALSLPSDT